MLSIEAQVLSHRQECQEGCYPPPNPEEPGAFVMADPERVRKLVVGAGFAEPEIEEIPFRWRFANQEAYWRFLSEVAGPFSRSAGDGLGAGSSSGSAVPLQ